MSTKKPTIAGPAEWHHLDADGRVLGRLATEVAALLLGKHRTDFVRHQIAPVFVIVTNTNTVALTGRKEDQKVYQHFTGYPGGLKTRSIIKQRQLDSRKIVYEAVYGMLPKNSLRDERMNHLKLYATANHPHEAQVAKAH
jgi:large subunit ribosomal protein L13